MELKKFEKRVYLSSPTMHPESFQYMKEAYDTNWMSTVGANINEVERIACEKIGCKYAVALSSGTAALHMAVKLAKMAGARYMSDDDDNEYVDAWIEYVDDVLQEIIG